MARKATKRCTKGDHVVPVDDFYRDKSQKDGRSPWCKTCERAYNKAYRASLKSVESERVRDIEDDAHRATFNKGMKGERVTRNTRRVTKDATRTTKAKARTKARKGARVAKAQAKA